LAIEKMSIYGNPNIGAFCQTNNHIALVPFDAPDKVGNLILEILDVAQVIKCKVGGSRAIGILTSMNDNGLLLPSIITSEELEYIKSRLKADIVVEVLNSRHNALGNLILVNNKACLAADVFDRKSLKVIEDVFDVEVMVGRISEFNTVGSVAVVNDKGLLLPPSASKEEIQKYARLFKVENADVGTVNRGKPYIRIGLLANNKGCIVGEDTTGPELAHIGLVLGVM